MSRRARRTIALAILVLAALVAADIESAYIHHDDGCSVEIHCLACRLTLGSTAVITNVVLGIAPAPDVVGAPPLLATRRTPRAALESRRPRGPPSA
jgi:hypothetical protein